MAKKSSWFDWVKKFFISEVKTKPEKKTKRPKCVAGRLLKFRKFDALSAPERSLSEATERQRKHALNVAAATAAAAEAAVAAAHAAAEVVRLMGSSRTCRQFTKKQRYLAAIKIQSAFRAYLARKALRALKGLVRLQAIARGRAVRRRAKSTLECVSSNVKKQAEVLGKEDLGEKEIMLECNNNQRNWDFSVLSKEDMEGVWLRKQEALVKRERMKKYSYSHREGRNVHRVEESRPHKERQASYGVEKEMFLKPAVRPNLITGEIYIPTQVRLRNKRMHESLNGLNSPHSFPRRSFCRAQQNINTSEDENSGLNSPVFPTFMAATQSPKAKARSMSTPRQHSGFLANYFGQTGPYRNDRLSLWSSYNGESFINNGKSCTSQPSLSKSNIHL